MLDSTAFSFYKVILLDIEEGTIWRTDWCRRNQATNAISSHINLERITEMRVFIESYKGTLNSWIKTFQGYSEADGQDTPFGDTAICRPIWVSYHSSHYEIYAVAQDDCFPSLQALIFLINGDNVIKGTILICMVF